MKLILVASAVVAACNGLNIPRQLPASITQGTDIPDAIGNLNPILWVGPGTIGGSILGFFMRNGYDMPNKYESMPPRLRTTSRRDRLWYGPMTLPAINATRPPTGRPEFLKMDPTSTQFDKRIGGFCSDCTVLAGQVSLYFENGTKAGVDSGVYVHHLVTVDMAQSSKGQLPFYLCDEQSGFLGKWPSPAFLVSGNDEAPNLFTTPDGTFNSGYHMADSRFIAMQAELVNYRAEAQAVFVVIDYEWMPAPAPGSRLKAGPLETPANSALSLLSVTGCKPPDFHPNERVYSVSSAQVRIPHNGFIINAKGHLHDGGDYAVLKLNGKEICRSNAVYGKSATDVNVANGAHGHFASSNSSSPADDGPSKPAPVAPGTITEASKGGNGNGTDWAVITEMTQCTDPIPVRRGDYLSMTAYMDGVKHPPRPLEASMNGMGGMGGGHSGGGGGHKMEADEMGVFFINFATSNETAAQLTLSTDKIKPPRS